MAKKKLTPKQNKFKQEYLKHFNGTKAYQAVYNVSENVARANASRLLTNANMQEALAKSTEKQAENADITVQEIIRDLKILKDRCMQEIQVLNKKGEPTGEYQFDSSGANRSLELLGKHLAMFTDKFQVKSDDLHITVTIENEGDGGVSGKPEHIGSNVPDQS